MFEDSRSLSSTNFPATIWPTSFAGIGENSSPTMKGWCRIGAETEGKALFIARPAWDATGEAMIAQDVTSNGFGVAKVRTNDGTTRAGLPWEEDTWAKEECVENPVPAVHKAEAWELKSWSGMPPSMADEELLVAWSRTLQFPDGSRQEMDACSAGNKALTAWTTAASNSGDGWAALPATVVDALWANRRMRWNRCGRTIRFPCGEKGSILTVTSASRASRARHILQLKARIRNDLLSNRSVKISSKMPAWDAT